jgi:hypothetical protein
MMRGRFVIPDSSDRGRSVALNSPGPLNEVFTRFFPLAHLLWQLLAMDLTLCLG